MKDLTLTIRDAFSANRMHRARKIARGGNAYSGVGRSNDYRKWHNQTREEFWAQAISAKHEIYEGPVKCTIFRGERQKRFDIDNCAKPILDAIEAAGNIIRNDRQFAELHISEPNTPLSLIHI